MVVAIIYTVATGEFTSTGNTTTPIENAGENQVSALQENTPQTSNSSTQVPPRDSNGVIHQLKINASVESRKIAFTSGENYTNCSNDLTVITIGDNQQPVFTLYKDNFSAGMNLFTGDQHSIAYGSLTNDSGDTLVADIVSGKYGSNAAGTWGLTCDQGNYSFTISKIQ